MPIYTFKCTSCGKVSEILTNNMNIKFEKCDECGGEMERQFPRTAGAIFKGSGFYETDYKDRK